MTPDQKASYLADLRKNRPMRPTGSRPLPSRHFPINDENLPPRAGSALSFRTSNHEPTTSMAVSKEQKLSHRASLPTTKSYGSLASQKGRPLVPAPGSETTLPSSTRRGVSPPGITFAEAEYCENPYRVREREEAQALRQALKRIDLVDDEKRLHEAAKMEAADLVWKHQNPQLAQVEKTAAYRNPDLERRKYGGLGHANKDAEATQARSQPNSRSASAESTSSTDSKRPRLPWLQRRPKPAIAVSMQEQLEEKESIIQRGVRKISGKRYTSSGSSKGVFRNREDEIYEEAEETPSLVEPTEPQQLPLKSRESNSLPRSSRPLPAKPLTNAVSDKAWHNGPEMWKNPPAQSRNAPEFTTSRALPSRPVKESQAEEDDEPRYKDGIEIRSDDIRAATSRRKSERSPNLPTPTAVSDRPGRPIVSFDPKWRPSLDSPRNNQDPSRSHEHSKNGGSMAYPVQAPPPVPEITIMEEPRSPMLQKEEVAHREERPTPTVVVPSINVAGEPDIPASSPRPLPRISLPDDTRASEVAALAVEAEGWQRRPLPASPDCSGGSRPSSHPTPSAAARPRPTQSEVASIVPWLSRAPTSSLTSSVSCTACGLAIAGRIVTASGSATRSQKARFHPECFSCHHCSTGLEAVAFYPEPENARLERFQALMSHLPPEDDQIRALANSNEDLHFFCHLDYHEQFSPRCHNCKTPIEGAAVVALGRHYHADHFFCAECGDPFTSDSPFVEHNGYPYCVGCHTKRTSARCSACRLPVLNEMTIEALGENGMTPASYVVSVEEILVTKADFS